MHSNLWEGVRRFQGDVFAEHAERFRQLEQGQSPSTLFITCSDSRIDPSLLTQTGPGELFVIRNAGNIVPEYPSDGGEAATIEYAIEVLNVSQVIICGHSYCGAVQGLLNPSLVEKLPAVRGWLRHSKNAVPTTSSGTSPANDPSVLDGVRANVRLQLSHLLTYPFVKRRVESKQLHVQGWVYEFQSGKVSVSTPERDSFTDIGEWT